MPGGISFPIPSTTDSEKPALLDEIKSIEDSQALFGFFGLVGTLPSSLVGLPGASLTIVGVPIYFLQRQKNATKRRLEDPPREDFNTGVRAKPRRFHPEALGDTPAERAVGEWGVRSLRYTAYLEAVVRADERAQEAMIERDLATADKRLAEGARAAHRASEAASSTATAARRAGDQLVEVVPSELIRQGREYVDRFSDVIDLRKDLPEELAYEASQAGLVIEDLDPKLEADPERLSLVAEQPEEEITAVINRYSDSTELAAARTAEGYQPSEIRKRLESSPPRES